jgi:hypothetical protein
VVKGESVTYYWEAMIVQYDRCKREFTFVEFLGPCFDNELVMLSVVY